MKNSLHKSFIVKERGRIIRAFLVNTVEHRGLAATVSELDGRELRLVRRMGLLAIITGLSLCPKFGAV